MFFSLLAVAADVFGTVAPPPGVWQYDAASPSKFGLILFLSNMIRLAALFAGLWVFANLILAGLMYVTGAGESGMPDKVKDKVLHSVIGLAIIVLSVLVIALISLLFFGDPGYILNPTITGPGP